jgi:hypothetical protein
MRNRLALRRLCDPALRDFNFRSPRREQGAAVRTVNELMTIAVDRPDVKEQGDRMALWRSNPVVSN